MLVGHEGTEESKGEFSAKTQEKHKNNSSNKNNNKNRILLSSPLTKYTYAYTVRARASSEILRRRPVIDPKRQSNPSTMAPFVPCNHKYQHTLAIATRAAAMVQSIG